MHNTIIQSRARKVLQKSVFLIVPVIVLFLTACDSKMVFEKNKKMDEATWNSTDIVKFNVAIPDTLAGYNYYINIRNTTDYGFANLFMFVKTVYPDGKISVDTVECYLADIQGRWLGKGQGRIIDNRILFRKSVRFPQAGVYSFEYEQGMRVNQLYGIEDIGIRIEKSE
jgi:gliding motility-associated lipoprotein GldH